MRPRLPRRCVGQRTRVGSNLRRLTLARWMDACSESFDTAHSSRSRSNMSGIKKGSAPKKPAGASAAGAKKPAGATQAKKSGGGGGGSAGAKKGGGGGGGAGGPVMECFAGCGVKGAPDTMIQHYEKCFSTNEIKHIQALSDKARTQTKTRADAECAATSRAMCAARRTGTHSLDLIPPFLCCCPARSSLRRPYALSNLQRRVPSLRSTVATHLRCGDREKEGAWTARSGGCSACSGGARHAVFIFRAGAYHDAHGWPGGSDRVSAITGRA